MNSLYALLALLVPLVVAVVTNKSTPSWVQGGLATAVSVCVGVIMVFFRDSQSIQAVAGSVVAVIVAAQASYSMIWKPLGVTSWILEHLGNTTTAPLQE